MELYEAAFKRDLEGMRAVLEGVSGQAQAAWTDERGWTALHACCSIGYEEGAQLLLEKRANPALASEEGWTPLAVAAQYGRAQLVRLLLRGGASAEGAPQARWSPLMMAAMRHDADTARALLEGGADPQRAGPGGDTASSLSKGGPVAQLIEQGVAWQRWSVADVQRHFQELGARPETLQRLRDEDVDGAVLAELSEQEMRDVGLTLGMVKKHMAFRRR